MLFRSKKIPYDLNGSIVFVGASAYSLNDLVTTPLQKLTYPGVEVHASIAASMLDQHFLHYPAWAIGFEAASVVLFGVLLSCLLPFLGVLSLSV